MTLSPDFSFQPLPALEHEILEPFPPNDLYNYAYVLKYRVLKVHRGQIPNGEILVGQYNPLKPRERVQDDVSGTGYSSHNAGLTA